MLLKKIIYKFLNKRVLKKDHLPYPINLMEYFRISRLERYKLYTTAVYQHPFRLNDGYGFIHSVKEIFEEEVYYFQSDKKDPLIIDCGANIGLSIVFFKQLFPDAAIIAFEPDADIFELLKFNVSNAAYQHVTLHQAAAWVENTELDFFVEGSLAGSLVTDFTSKNTIEKVKAIRLKTFLQQPIDFLKIDIEGAENRVLFDLEPELQNVKALFVEYHSSVGEKQILGALLDCIVRNGFRYSISNAANVIRRPFINQKKRGFDIQLNISCYRLS